MSWQDLFAAWRALNFPPCPASARAVDLVTLDADIAGLLLRCTRINGAPKAITLHQLRQLRERLGRVLGALSGECLASFEELEVVVLAVLEDGKSSP